MSEIFGLTGEAIDRARRSRDARFDGKFFIAVLSTGIYCRPICPARLCSTVRYYASAAEAAEAGFRPCLRCRPEAAPGSPAWTGTSAVVRRALRLIHEGALDKASVEDLATRVGMGTRHLNRLIVAQVGASPLAIAQTRRLHFAKRLLDDTNLPVTQIALASGYGSVRRFNGAIKATYKRSPRELRKKRARADDGADQITLRLAYRPPYDWDHVICFLSRRAIRGVEKVDADTYARTVRTSVGHATIKITACDDAHALQMQVRGAPPTDLFELSAIARRVFDLAADPVQIADAFRADPLLGPLVALRPGLRIAGSWDPFECAVRAIVEGRAQLLEERAELETMISSRLVARAGESIDGTDGLTHLFPSPNALAEADLNDVGLTSAQADAVHALAVAVRDGVVRFSDSVEDITRALIRIPGIGQRVAQYVALRAFGEPDAFPTEDLNLRRRAAADGAALTARALEVRAEAWRPWRGYAAFHLWAATR
jgi:AraC family transcriptional regulator, regulatory protein of adaptative response / DNA-3-methyladenine glycosylase II